MRPVELRVERLAVELSGELRPREVEATLRAALELLGRRLARAPLAGPSGMPTRALDRLELGPLSPDRLAGPGAPARLAEELYERLRRAA